MASTRILKFSQSENESSYVLVQVSSKGSKPLDLKLVGTEGEAPYVCSCELTVACVFVPNTLAHPIYKDETKKKKQKNKK